MTSSTNKMYFIAKHYNDLNASGMVKGFKGNEKGYARIKKIVNGCSLYVFHTLNDHLTINIMLTPTSKSRYELACTTAVGIFEKHFKPNYRFAIREGAMGDRYDNHIADVTNKELPEIISMIEEIKNKL